MKNVGTSVRTRLKNVSVQTGIDMPTLLRRYVQERLLYRLSVSSEAENFVLKVWRSERLSIFTVILTTLALLR